MVVVKYQEILKKYRCGNNLKNEQHYRAMKWQNMAEQDLSAVATFCGVLLNVR
jgi:hypothetical protein